MTEREALRLALDALENHTAIKHPQQIYYRDKAINSIKEALAQPEQEPVARVVNKSVVFRPCDLAGLPPNAPLYTAPPQRKLLTDEEIDRRLCPTNNEHEHDDRFWDGVEWAKAQIKE